jgi:hypothetical protein
MALAWPEGNRAGPLFPRLLLGLSAKMNLDRHRAENQLLSSDLIFLLNSFSAAALAIISPMMKKVGGSLNLQHFLRISTVGLDPVEKCLSFPSEAG